MKSYLIVWQEEYITIYYGPRHKLNLGWQVLAHRSLPFIVGRNPYIAEVYQLYESSFTTLSNFPPIRNLEDNERFTNTLDELVADHANNVPVLARGKLKGVQITQID